MLTQQGNIAYGLKEAWHNGTREEQELDIIIYAKIEFWLWEKVRKGLDKY
jgi:hypothetical protein